MKRRNRSNRFHGRVAVAANGCWEWTHGCDGRGYGRLKVNGKMVYAHRLAYENTQGSVPDGLEIDHLCRNHVCVRPSHLEAVDHRTNVLKGNGLAAYWAARTHCQRGHKYDVENTYVTKAGARACRACHKEATRRRRAWRTA